MKRFLILAVLLASFNAHGLISLSRQIASAQSMGASFDTSGIDITKVELMSIQAVWSGGGSPVGTFTVQVSNDVTSPVTGDPCGDVTNWSTYPGSSTAISDDGSLAVNIANLGYRCMRLSYARTSGTGTLNASANVKVE